MSDTSTEQQPRVVSPRTPDLHFDVSAGLKSVLGTELITDHDVAVFELIKNSFDAKARVVHVHFAADRIIVADNGSGMSLGDIRKKWLFVAYSAKREHNRNARTSGARNSYLAGSKGIGRFSSDRLGATVILQTRAKTEATKPVHRVIVDWDKFDENPRKHFETIGLSYQLQPDGFSLPSHMIRLRYGTAIEIRRLRRHWERADILKLKSALAKLINPFGSEVDRFKIIISAPGEEKKDAEVTSKALSKGEPPLPSQLVNGEVGNFIFETLKEKTTYIEVALARAGKVIESKLVDRGEVIYRTREPNPYGILSSSGFSCQLFFLNQSAKVTFKSRMGVPSVQFGSVFLFRNGFRVFPIGNEKDDWYGMDRRKQQGYARFLGTRDVIGRIDVSGSDDQFQEASSRNAGLIETPAVEELRKCFREHCLRRLERYVVPVTWADKEDKKTGDLSRLLTDPGRSRVMAAVAALVDGDDIELLEYSTKLIDLISERSEQFEGSLLSLRAIAEKTQDADLHKRIEQAELRFEELKRSEAEARRVADEERAAKDAAEARATKAEQAVQSATIYLDEEKKRNLFLTSIASLDKDIILNMHHQITIYAVDLQQQVENFLLEIEGLKRVPHETVLSRMDQIAFLNRKVLAVSKFATKANFRLESEEIEEDLPRYVVDYIEQIAVDFTGGHLAIEVESDGKEYRRFFKPIDVSIVVDNLISNSRKAAATKIKFELKQPTRNTLHMRVSDDGDGISSAIDDASRIFEKGVTATDGSGLGLYHVQQVLGGINGSIELVESSTRGTIFLIRISS